ncbi:MAG TPA: hypothetical protein VJB05_02260 [archaeon]|nr:hypothetical protein [archaeon]
MVDKLTELEERFNRLEEKLKITFIELEKRLNQQQLHDQPQTNVEDHIQEIEDLLLLLQLENTKMKEKIRDGLDFGIIPNVPDVSERLTRVESELASHASAIPSQSEIETKIATLEERINSLQPTNYVETRPVEEPVNEIEEEHVAEHHSHKKVKTVKEVLGEDSDLLSSVQKILGRA